MANSVEIVSMSTVVPLLSALLEHPEFAEGVRAAQEYFFDSYEEAPLSEEEMVEAVEMNLSRRVTERCKTLSRFFGYPPPRYFSDLGYVIGTISKGLTYIDEGEVS